MKTKPKLYNALRREVGEALYQARVTVRKSQFEWSADLEIAQQQYGGYEKLDGVDMKLSTAVALLDAAGYDLKVMKRADKRAPGRPGKQKPDWSTANKEKFRADMDVILTLRPRTDAERDARYAQYKWCIDVVHDTPFWFDEMTSAEQEYYTARYDGEG